MLSDHRYLIVGGDFYRAGRVAAEMNLSLRDWEFIFDRGAIVGYGEYETTVYERKGGWGNDGLS